MRHGQVTRHRKVQAGLQGLPRAALNRPGQIRGAPVLVVLQPRDQPVRGGRQFFRGQQDHVASFLVAADAPDDVGKLILVACLLHLKHRDALFIPPLGQHAHNGVSGLLGHLESLGNRRNIVFAFRITEGIHRSRQFVKPKGEVVGDPDLFNATNQGFARAGKITEPINGQPCQHRHQGNH